MNRPRRRTALVAALVVFASAWIVMGVGYNRMSEACYETRHANDREPEVYGGGIGLAVDVVFWPLFQTGNAFSGIDCSPVPASSPVR